MQQIVSTSAGEAPTFEVDRGGDRVPLKAVPALKESRTIRQCASHAVLGITRSPSPDDTDFQPVGVQGDRTRRAKDLVCGRAHALLPRRRHFRARGG